MFVDASAIVAILTREADAEFLTERLESASTPITSLSYLRSCRRHLPETPIQCRGSRERRPSILGGCVVVIAEAELAEALAAYARYGKGRGHPAQLNLGNCFAYAAAKTRDVPLLFKGDDFAKTDITPAEG